MPLSDLQSEILRLLATHRTPDSFPDSFISGATPLLRDGPRQSDDIDIFHDREAAVAAAAEADAAQLRAAGYTLVWLRREPALLAAAITRGGATTRLEWLRDSDFPFFPAVGNDLFGYRLHRADIATNKARAAASRREPRDVLDLLLIHDRYLPLGAVIWAAVAKDPDYAPESLVTEIRRNARYRDDDYAELALTVPVDAGEIARRFRQALAAAEQAIAALPPGTEGNLFLRDGIPVQPEPAHPGGLIVRAGQRGGHWPSSAEIGSAMLDRDPPAPR